MDKNLEVERINAIGSWSVKILALGGSLALAWYYDGTWLYVFFCMAMVLLGVELKTRLIGGKKE